MLEVLRGLLSPGRADDSFFVPNRSYDDYDYVRSEWIAVTALTFLWLLTLIARQVATFVEHQALRRVSEDPDREPLMRDRQTAERAGQWAPRFDRASDALRHALMMLLAAIVFVSIPLPYACKVDQPLQPGIPISPGPHCMTCLGNGTTLGTSIISWVFFALAALWLVLELVVADATSAALARTFVGLASFPLILAIFASLSRWTLTASLATGTTGLVVALAPNITVVVKKVLNRSMTGAGVVVPTVLREALLTRQHGTPRVRSPSLALLRARVELVRRTTASHIRYSTISTDEEYSLPDNRAQKTRRRESSTDSKASRARSRSRSPSRRWDERHQCYVSTSSRSVPRRASPRRSSPKTEFVPLDREWLPGPESKRIEDSGSKHKFTVMTYNCLAPSLVGSNAYLYRSSQKAHGRSIVEFSTRGPMLIADIVARASDIVCLQEVDDRYFSSFFEPQLAAHGYTGTFLRCTGTKTDGSAILVKSEVFDIVELKHVQFKPYKHNVAVVMILRSKELGRLICDMVEKQEAYTNCTIPFVFTGDLNINPGSFLHEFIVTGEADMANVDARYMSGQLFRRNWSGLMPLVTFQPSSSTSLHSTSYVSMDMDDDTPAPSSVPPDLAPKETPPPESWFGTTWCSLPVRAFGLNANSKGTTPQSSSQIARHPFTFTSVYAPYFDALTNEPYFTTWHDQVHELVDYIFYGHLKPEARTKTPSLTVDSIPQTHTHIECVRYLKPPAVKETARMPNPRCPSDHVYLLAEFVVRT
ncbi:hypothetical protein PhCBS80983_g01318 [Powellomyces hirtus]|uniref:Endonuclease/exonuclease/phosphatase domain-containing protein n=1 Tax=Powellomyces hirtus TaxID=109895 RepID=A0A507EAS1_9FUNG|nr:hypothetical protein PhCBS80983_g01318 [Powellomyces hirtus]